MKTAIVILNWNGRALLERFLPDVIAHSAEQATIYVVDNASTDDSIAFLQTQYPEIKLICHTENWGYAGGYNKAMAQIDADLICLMNNDIRTTPHWLNAIIEAFAANGRMALAQPKILDLNHPTHFEYAGAAGGMMDRFGYPYCRGRIFDTIEEDSDQYASAQVFWASGACLFVRKSVFESLGGFDDSFFAHMEEIDLCWRAQHQGHEVWALCNSSVLHLGGGTLTYGSSRKTRLNFRNSLFMLVKNTAKHLPFILIIRLLLDGIAAWRFMFKGQTSHFGAIFMAYMDFYRGARSYFMKRNKSLKIISLNPSIVWKYYILGYRKYRP